MQGSHWQEPDCGSARCLRAGSPPNVGLVEMWNRRWERQRARRIVLCSARFDVLAHGSSAGSTGSTAVKKTAESGGNVADTEYGRPCHGSATAVTPPMLPQPLPP